jgi:hypothetical protein
MNGYSYLSQLGNNYSNYNSYNGYSNYGQIPQYQQPISQLPKTNKIFVTSLEEAISRPAEPNTEIVYLHQNEPLLFQIATDIQGKKSYKAFKLMPLEEVQKKEETVSRLEFEELKKKVNNYFEKNEEGIE